MVYRALVDAVMGEPDPPDAQAAWQPVPLVRSAARVDLTSVSVASLAVELADANDDPALAANALDVLTAAYARGVRFTPGWCAFVPRLAGVASMLAGDLHGAEMWLATARADALRAGAVGEAARVEYDRARTKLSAGGAADASEDLERAIADLERVGYRQLLAAARRLAGRPDADLVDGGEAQRVILVTDLIDSTPLTRRVGDRRFVELLREHNRIMRTRLRQFDGVEFKHTGDGIAAWFLTAGAAIECGLRIQEDIERSNIARPEDPLYVRIGISAGEVVVEDERDVYGLAVITAFRVCDHARDGRILVSSDVPPLVRESSFGFTEVGDVVLKGFTDPHTLYAVTPKRP
jgi:class 3 adenylate cyclase